MQISENLVKAFFQHFRSEAFFQKKTEITTHQKSGWIEMKHVFLEQCSFAYAILHLCLCDLTPYFDNNNFFGRPHYSWSVFRRIAQVQRYAGPLMSAVVHRYGSAVVHRMGSAVVPAIGFSGGPPLYGSAVVHRYGFQRSSTAMGFSGRPPLWGWFSAR